MKIGILRSVGNITHGGLFQYEKAFIDALGELAPHSGETFVYLTYLRGDLKTLAGSGGLSYRGLSVEFLESSPVESASLIPDTEAEPQPHPAIDPNDIYFDRKGAESLRRAQIDLILQISPSAYTFSLGIPFVMPIFDLNHRLQPEFPEVSAFGEYQMREYFYINVCRYATMVLVDSEAGKADVLRFYGDYIDEGRISIVPYYPPTIRGRMPNASDCARVAAKYTLPPRYLFYPAQFWEHKNHARILKAQRIIRDETGERVPLVLVGAHSDYHRARTFRQLMTLRDELGLIDDVHYLGSVPDIDMPGLYVNSVGLVMPTFFGPTNIPPFEAWHYGRPVITSDIPGIRAQIGDAGLLVDPRSAEDLARAMLEVWQNQPRVAALVEAGNQRLQSFSWDAFKASVQQAIADACTLVRNGQTPLFPDVISTNPIDAPGA